MKAQFVNLRIQRISLMISALLYAGSVFADAASYSVNIPAQRLDTALQSLAQQSGTQILFVTDTVNNYQSENLSGQLTVEQALTELLKSKNLQIKKIGENKFSIVEGKPQARNMGQLNTIDVNARAGSRQNLAGTTGLNQLPVITVVAEGENSYTVKSSKSATKLDLSLKETPQSVTVITRQQIEDQNLNNVSAILDQTPGVTNRIIGQYGAGFDGNDVYYSRGFVINNYQRDGIPTSAASFGGGAFIGLEDSAIYERIEITRGSTGLTSGSGNPAASLNYVRKRPTKDLTGSIRVQAGSWNNYRSEVDVSGGLNTDSSIRGRTVAVYEQGGSQQERYYRQNAVIYGALDFDLSDKTTLTTAINAQQIKFDDVAGQSFRILSDDSPQQPTNFSRKDNAAANFTYADTEKLNLILGLEHQFNDQWQGIVNYSFSKASREQIYGYAGAVAVAMGAPYYMAWGDVTLQPGEMSFSASRVEYNPEVHSLDIYASGNFDAFGEQHSVSFGLNGYSIKQDDPNFIFHNFAVPIAGWNGQVARPDFYQSGSSFVDEKQLGAFAAAKLQLLDPIKLIVGSRFSNFEREATARGGIATMKENSVFTPYAGLIFDINDNFSLYASYTSIFNPQTSKDVNGNYLDSEEGNSLEAGIKADFYDGRLNLAAAYFDMQQDNYAIADGSNITPEGNQAYIGADGVTVKGYEFSISGEILPNWNINAGYTHTDAKDRTGGVLNTELPEDTFKLFSTYKWNKLTVGGGVNWQSDFYASWSTTEAAKKYHRQDAYWLVNLMGRYQINDAASVSLNANNLLDEEYRVSAATSSWGAGRNVTASLTYKF